MFRGTASRVTVFNPHPPSMKPAGLGKVVSLLMWAIVIQRTIQYDNGVYEALYASTSTSTGLSTFLLSQTL